MARYIKTIKSKAGKAPGTLVYDDEMERLPVEIDMHYHKNGVTEHKKIDPETVFEVLKGNNRFWINIVGNPEIEWLEQLGRDHGIHRLTLEDIISLNQRPKTAAYQDYVFFCLKMLYKGKKKSNALLEQLSILQFPHGVITFQITGKDPFSGIRNRLKNANARIYQLAPDYLVFCLLDTIVDHYMIVTETVGQRIDNLEDTLFNPEKTSKNFIERFSGYQRELNILRKNIRPVEEILIQTRKHENQWVQDENEPYYNDVFDHLLLVKETVDAYRNLLSDMLNIHSTQVGNDLNQVMKTLTIFSAVFIPITFIAGVYGTNFEYLPELSYRYSYFIFWGLMITVAGGMMYYFRKKKWF